MAITAWKILKNGGTGEATGRDSTGNSRSFEAVYQLTSDSELDGPNTALNYFESTTGLPWYGDPYQVGNDQFADAVCVRIAPSRAGQSNFFNVPVRWEEPGGGGGSEPEAVSVDLQAVSPLFWHDQIELTETYISVPIRAATFRGYYRPHDLTSEDTSITNPHLNSGTGYRGPIVNSAVDPYDPEPEGEIPIEVLRITRNVWPWNDGLAKTFRNTVNNAAVTISKPDYGFEKIIDPFCGRIVSMGGAFEVDLEYRVKYYRMTIEVHINPLGWRLVMIDKGLRRKALVGDETETGVTINANTVNSKVPPLTHIKDPSGEKVYGPVLLDGTGKPAVGAGSLPAKPVLHKWEHYTEITWEGIPW